MTHKKEFPTNSTYRAPITVVDDETGDKLDATTFDEIKYEVRKNTKSGTVLYEKTDDDSEVRVNPNDSSEVIVDIPAPDVTWEGEVLGELRLSENPPDKSVATLQREVYFYPVMTEP